MTQRRRMSRAAVERTPEREVMRGVSASLWWVDDHRIVDDPLPKRPPAQNAALFRREDVERAARSPGAVMTPEAFDEVVRLTRAAPPPPPPPQSIVMSAEMLREMERFGARERSDDYSDALAFVWSRVPVAARAERTRRQALERTGRVLVAWLIGRWRR